MSLYFTELERHSGYEFKIAAVTVNGTGPYTEDWLQEYTLEFEMDGKSTKYHWLVCVDLVIACNYDSEWILNICRQGAICGCACRYGSVPVCSYVQMM